VFPHRHSCSTLLIAALAGLTATPALAAGACKEGRTASGACVKPELAKLMRTQTVVATQPKISYSAPPVLPGDDSTVAPHYSRYEVLNLLTPQTARGSRRAP